MSTQSKLVYDAGKSSGALVRGIIFSVIKLIVAGVIATIGAFIPIVGWVVSICSAIFAIIEIVGVILLIIGYCTSLMNFTETGIYIKNAFMDQELSFAKIARVYPKGTKAMIEFKVDGASRNKVIQYTFAEDADTFCKAYETQRAKAINAEIKDFKPKRIAEDIFSISSVLFSFVKKQKSLYDMPSCS